MDLVRWRDNFLDPSPGLDSLQQEINRLFENPRSSMSYGIFDRSFSPAVDVVEAEDEFTVFADVPGIPMEKLDLSLADNVLTIKGEKKTAETAGKVFRKETVEGSFQRTLSLPSEIDPDSIEATLKDGVLTIRIAKREEAKPKKIAISVN